MRKSTFLKPLLATLAILFAAATILYTALRFYAARWQPPVELGFDSRYLGAEHGELVRRVQNGSSMASAGLIVGDRIVAIDGRPIASPFLLMDVLSRRCSPADHRAGSAALGRLSGMTLHWIRIFAIIVGGGER